MKLWYLVKKMINEADRNNLAELIELNRQYEIQAPHDITQSWLNRYDNARQSCFMAMQIPQMKEEYLQDARQRLKYN